MNTTWLLFLNVLIIATCGLVYELLAGTLASYVLGDSVTQFSLIIGLYLSAMGVGAWLSNYIEERLARTFIEVELGVALLGGLSAPLLFFGFGRLSNFHVLLYSVVFAIGVLVGLELPLLMRILRNNMEFKDLVARVLAFDYLGALVASLLFPLLLVPRLGLVRTSLMFGLLNAAVGLWGTWLLRPQLSRGVLGLRARCVAVLMLLTVGVVYADRLTSLAEDNLYADEIVYARTSPYQRIVLTRSRAGFQLFLSGNLQFSSADEYRYHEALVHPALLLAGGPKRVLILGGGDGLAAREVLRYPSVERVTLVDLDPAMTQLSERFPPLGELNGGALRDPRVEVVNEDAMLWLETPREKYDAVLIDFPDPNNFALGKLYTTRFYRLLRGQLTPEAAIGVQCTSPLFARSAYWCIVRTMEAAGLHVRPYHVAVPSFGVWGFALARSTPFELPAGELPRDLKFLDGQSLAAMFTLSPDLGPVPVEINRLDNQALVRYYDREWRRWN
jgi:spermidine synthase